MAINPKMLSGAEGVIQDQIEAGVLYCYWSRSRIHWKQKVHLGCVISGWPDGTAVKLVVYESDDAGEDDLVVELDASIEKGIATAEHEVDFEDPDDAPGGEYTLYFCVEIDGEQISGEEACPYLLVDMTLPVFSE